MIYLQVIGILEYLAAHVTCGVSWCPEFMAAKVAVGVESEEALRAPFVQPSVVAMLEQSVGGVEASITLFALVGIILLIHYDVRHNFW